MNHTLSAFTVVRTTYWDRFFGGPQIGGGITGQVTHIRADGVNAYVRENIRTDTFMMNSGHRRGVAEGTADMPGAQVLNLATDGDWERIAAVVRDADAMGRPVVRSRRWSMNAARELFVRKGAS